MNEVPLLNNNPSIDMLLDTPTKRCSKCGGALFQARVVLKEVPGYMFGQPQETVVYPLKVYVCSKCGHIIEDDIKMYKLEALAEELSSESSESMAAEDVKSGEIKLTLD